MAKSPDGFVASSTPFPRSQANSANTAVEEALQDETGFECFVNQFHLENVLGSTWFARGRLADSDMYEAAWLVHGLADDLEGYEDAAAAIRLTTPDGAVEHTSMNSAESQSAVSEHSYPRNRSVKQAF